MQALLVVQKFIFAFCHAVLRKVRQKVSHTLCPSRDAPGPSLKYAKVMPRLLMLHKIHQLGCFEFNMIMVAEAGQFDEDWQGGPALAHTSLVLTAMAFSLRISKLRPPFILTQTSVVSCTHM